MSIPFTESHSYPSYSQAGEDRILYYFFERRGSVQKLRYCDVGAANPAGHNNTYLFNTLGGTGVLVEADPMYLPAYQLVRPSDFVENIAVVPKRLSQSNTITFHKMEDRGWSTVSAEHAKIGTSQGKGAGQQITVNCCDINTILKKHFPDGKLDILSLDIEGIDFEVAMEIELDKFRPQSIIIENSHSSREKEDLDRYINEKNYVYFASTHINTIYVSRESLEKFKY